MGEGFGERLLLRASYRCIYRTLRQLIKFSPKPSHQNSIYMCFTTASILLQRWDPYPADRSPLKISKRKLYVDGVLWHSNSMKYRLFRCLYQNFTHTALRAQDLSLSRSLLLPKQMLLHSNSWAYRWQTCRPSSARHSTPSLSVNDLLRKALPLK